MALSVAAAIVGLWIGAENRRWLGAADSPGDKAWDASNRKRIVVGVDAANIREGPSITAAIQGKLLRGHAVRVAAKKDNWVKIETTQAGRDLEGWIREDLLAEAPRLTAKSQTGPRQAPSTPPLCRDPDLASGLSVGIYRIDRETKNVYVNDLWYKLAYDQKQALVFYAQECLGITRIREHRTGRTVAQRTWSGFEIRE